MLFVLFAAAACLVNNVSFYVAPDIDIDRRDMSCIDRAGVCERNNTYKVIPLKASTFTNYTHDFQLHLNLLQQVQVSHAHGSLPKFSTLQRLSHPCLHRWIKPRYLEAAAAIALSIAVLNE